MKLMNRYLPEFDFAEEHSLYIPASARRVLNMVGSPGVLDDPIARKLIMLRELPGRVGGRLGFRFSLSSRPPFGIANFTYLGRDEDNEVAYGLAGKFWQSDYGLLETPWPSSFDSLRSTGIAKLVMNFTAVEQWPGTLLTTRTRVWCADTEAKRKFKPYWLMIRPASGFIRRRLLARVRDAVLNR